MKRVLILIAIFIFLLIVVVLGMDNFASRHMETSSVSDEVLLSPTPTAVSEVEETENEKGYPREAMFKIVTNGVVRNFSNPMYQDQSKMAFIPSGQPQTIIVTEESTWQEFFDTLPFSLDEECLTTGDGDRFCDGEGGTLEFELNGELLPVVLDRVIESNDLLIVSYE